MKNVSISWKPRATGSFWRPAIGLLHNLMYEAEPWGITYQKAEDTGVVHQFECAQKVFAELRKRGLRVLVGGDYGFPWTPHGTNARDLEHFVRFFGYSDSEALVAATRTGAAAMMLGGQTGEITKGFLADLLVVAGAPQDDVRLLQRPRQHQTGDERRQDLQESFRNPALTGDVSMFQHAALSLEDAKRVAAAARAEAEKNGWAIVIAVVDDGGHLMYLERMDGTQKASSRIAEAKGRTAILFKRPTKAIEDNVLEGRTVMMGLPGAVPLDGGVPLMKDGQFVGGIGVSGVQSFQDGIVARAGAAAL